MRFRLSNWRYASDMLCECLLMISEKYSAFGIFLKVLLLWYLHLKIVWGLNCLYDCMERKDKTPPKIPLQKKQVKKIVLSLLLC